MYMSKQRPVGDKKANIKINIGHLTSETLPENKKNKTLTCLNKSHFWTLLTAPEYSSNCYSSNSLFHFTIIGGSN